MVFSFQSVQLKGYLTYHFLEFTETMLHQQKEFQDRLIDHLNHDVFSQTFILDGYKALASVHYTDRSSKKLKDWILSSSQTGDFDEILYFAYTNELLFQFLAYELDNLDVKILARDWVTERKEEDEYNKALLSQLAEDENIEFRIWNKAILIKNRAGEINIAREKAGRKIDQRFYTSSPLFNGAILVSKTGACRGYVGFSKWVESNTEGGSPYKLRSWPAFELDSRDKNHAHMLDYLVSRYNEMWANSIPYAKAVENDEYEEARDLYTVGKVWEMDNLPYLIVIPGRHIPNRVTPVVAGEDEEASRLIERFLRTYGGKVKHLRVPLPEIFDHSNAWYPKPSINEIDKWPGHVIYICNLSVPPDCWEYLEKIDFPYKIADLGKPFPKIINEKNNISLTSPFDQTPPGNFDYSLIAKLNRPKSNAKGFIIAGLNALGTWGASQFMTDIDQLKLIAQSVSSNQFGAVVKTELNLKARKIENVLGKTRLFIAPEEFPSN